MRRRGSARGSDYYVIEPGGRGATYRHTTGYTVYKMGVYPRHSVLAGQVSRTWMDRFETVDEAKAKYPTAELIAGTSYSPPYLGHLPDDGDY